MSVSNDNHDGILFPHVGELDLTEGAEPIPLVDLPADSDLKVVEAEYLPEQLADPEFIYREMLMLRGTLNVVMQQRDELIIAGHQMARAAQVKQGCLTGVMVERMALAIMPSAYEPDEDGSITLDRPRIAREIARAALYAIREPTANMEVAGSEEWASRHGFEGTAAAIWRAMVDEALR